MGIAYPHSALCLTPDRTRNEQASDESDGDVDVLFHSFSFMLIALSYTIYIGMSTPIH